MERYTQPSGEHSHPANWIIARGHTGMESVTSIAYSTDGWHIISGSWDKAIHVWDSSPHIPVHLTSSAIQAGRPDPVLYWVPPKTVAQTSISLTISLTSPVQSISLQYMWGACLWNLLSPNFQHGKALAFLYPRHTCTVLVVCCIGDSLVVAVATSY